MPEDVKSLTKKCADLEKRLKSAEARIKALADNMTSPKDIEKYIDVVRKESSNSEKGVKRELELQQKANEALVKQETQKALKHVEKMKLESRLTRLEALVHAALAK
ncbi:hypothetical protein [Pukyongiella litopenaei]|uniref:Uncharacterized protein n=1 Tax=Pukyongiella litopenaei TaxID=2605946 RepID=A0A2S0MQN1_9RHOB|nr:hypothetical protein [Pukyongiella litopenaei]AVO38182.1 hypothetical protein C6Y53_11000 [Pukyongiella litopenaei]